MATVPLPDQVSFEQLRNQAKDLRRAVRAGAPDALAEVAERYPGGVAAGAAFPLHAAQLVVARRYGFASWARLKQHCAVIERYTRFPPTDPDDPDGPLGQIRGRAGIGRTRSSGWLASGTRTTSPRAGRPRASCWSRTRN